MPSDRARLDAALAALRAYDWGADAGALAPIDEAVIAARGEPALHDALERELAALLAADCSRATKEYVCRRLALVGRAPSVPALAALLDDRDHSHMARFALERIDGPEAGAALRAALATTTGERRIGVVSSLVARDDAAAVPLLAALLSADAPLAIAAASGLGRLATPAAAAALAAAPAGAPPAVAAAVVDARLACADACLARGDRAAARPIFDSIAAAVGDSPASHRDRALRVAARRGQLACLDTAG